MRLIEKESDIQYTILEYLRMKKVFCYKSNNVGIFNKKTGSYIPSTVKGLPDIICVIDGKYIGIEVKSKIGKQSEDQKNFQKNLIKAGGMYILAKSVEDIMTWI